MQIMPVCRSWNYKKKQALQANGRGFEDHSGKTSFQHIFRIFLIESMPKGFIQTEENIFLNFLAKTRDDHALHQGYQPVILVLLPFNILQEK